MPVTVAGCLASPRRASRPSRSPIFAFLAALLGLASLLAAPAASAADWRDAPAAPPGARVGLQVGHLRIEELPEDQARLRGQTGGAGGGYREVDINLAVTTRAAALLEARGVAVDILPATVPKGYRADAFIAIHCDANASPALNGYKLARYRESAIPARDDALVALLGETYGAATGLRVDPGVSRNMTGYYAYNYRRYETIVDRRTPSAIIELGFLTHPGDRAVLVGRQDLLAEALAAGILRFLAADRAYLAQLPVPDRSPWVP